MHRAWNEKQGDNFTLKVISEESQIYFSKKIRK